MHKRTVTALIAGLFIMPTSTAVAAPAAIPAGTSSPTPTAAASASDETVIINGRTYGPEDGLVITSGSAIVSPPAPGTVTTQDVFFSKYWGSSYVSSNESDEIRYQGEAYAAANVYNGLRYIQTCFQYRRDGSNLTPWVCSTADSSRGYWRAGPVVNRVVYDTLDPYAPQTSFHYKSAAIDPNIV